MKLRKKNSKGRYVSGKEIEIKIDEVRTRVERFTMPYIM